MLLILALINFLNYVDRQIIFPMFPVIKASFHVSDFQLGLLGTAFMLVHSLTTLPLGILADRYSRPKIISSGVLFWSVASFASGLSQSFGMLLGIRSLVGIGEASYAPAATAMISDNFPAADRSRAQGVFNIGMFAGGTIGAMLGGVIAYYFTNWRIAFFIVSVPGIVLAFFSLHLRDTARLPHAHGFEKIGNWVRIKNLLKRGAYVWLLIGATLSTFATGAFISWGVVFVVRYKGYNLRDASLILGLSLLVAGILGVYLGSVIADALQKRFASGRAITVALSLIIAGPCMFLGLENSISRFGFLFFFFLGTMFLSFYHGPATAVIHDAVPKSMRATSFALYLLVVHLLGDTFAPAIIGKISDIYSLKAGLEGSTVLVFFGGLMFLIVAYYAQKHGHTTEAETDNDIVYSI